MTSHPHKGRVQFFVSPMRHKEGDEFSKMTSYKKPLNKLNELIFDICGSIQ